MQIFGVFLAIVCFAVVKVQDVGNLDPSPRPIYIPAFGGPDGTLINCYNCDSRTDKNCFDMQYCKGVQCAKWVCYEEGEGEKTHKRCLKSIFGTNKCVYAGGANLAPPLRKRGYTECKLCLCDTDLCNTGQRHSKVSMIAIAIIAITCERVF